MVRLLHRIACHSHEVWLIDTAHVFMVPPNDCGDSKFPHSTANTTKDGYRVIAGACRENMNRLWIHPSHCNECSIGDNRWCHHEVSTVQGACSTIQVAQYGESMAVGHDSTDCEDSILQQLVEYHDRRVKPIAYCNAECTFELRHCTKQRSRSWLLVCSSSVGILACRYRRPLIDFKLVAISCHGTACHEYFQSVSVRLHGIEDPRR